jgi:hypothetical protein
MGPKKGWFSGIADTELMFPKYDRKNRYLVHNCYLNPPTVLQKSEFDGVLIMSTFLDKIVGNGLNSKFSKRYDFLKKFDCVKIAFPQDDYWYSEVRDTFYVDWGIDRVYPVISPESWDELIPRFLATGKSVKQGYTCYVTDYIRKAQSLSKPWNDRKNWVVYRATKIPKAPNQFGIIKGIIGERFKDALKDKTIGSIDISTDPRKIINGDNWICFVSNSRSILGSNSGSSVLLRNHTVFKEINDYKLANPIANLIEVEEKVIHENDRNKNYTAISPRNLEAASLGTLQLLVPGPYSGMLKPYIHYVPLIEDCSNIDEVLSYLNDEKKALKIVELCRENLLNMPELQVESLIKEIITLIGSKATEDTSQNSRLCFNKAERKFHRNIMYQMMMRPVRQLSRAIIMCIFPKKILARVIEYRNRQ